MKDLGNDKTLPFCLLFIKKFMEFFLLFKLKMVTLNENVSYNCSVCELLSQLHVEYYKEVTILQTMTKSYLYSL